MIGKNLAGRYELLEKIGEGGMAQVYRGWDSLLRRTVAIKVLKEQMTGDSAFVQRFRREAQSAAGLSPVSYTHLFWAAPPLRWKVTTRRSGAAPGFSR